MTKPFLISIVEYQTLHFMKPLIVLLATFGLSLLIFYFAGHTWQYVWAGNIAMSVMLLFTAMAHFAFLEGMSKMLPAFLPFKKEIVALTGFIEIAGAIGLLIPSARYLTGMALIVFFILILPANILAALKKVDYQKATNEGPGVSYLWFRIPLQVFFIAWVAWFAL
jgi:uncharacterized membrane protein